MRKLKRFKVYRKQDDCKVRKLGEELAFSKKNAIKTIKKRIIYGNDNIPFFIR